MKKQLLLFIVLLIAGTSPALSIPKLYGQLEANTDEGGNKTGYYTLYIRAAENIPSGSNIYSHASDVGWSDINNKNLITTVDFAKYKEEVEQAHPTNLSSFLSFSSVTSIKGLEYLNTSQVTNMYNMFSSCVALTSLDVTHFDTHNVTNMSHMFDNCEALTTIDLSSFDTHNVTDMSNMFSSCYSLKTVDLSNFDTQKVTNMHQMFAFCSSLDNPTLKGKFKAQSVTDMSEMFSMQDPKTNNATALKTLDLSNFDTQKVTNMHRMFFYCSSLDNLNLKGTFSTKSVTTMEEMFASCTSVKSLDVTNFETSNVTNMFKMFDDCAALTTVKLDNIKFDTRNVEYMQAMFNNCSSLTSLDVSKFNTPNLRTMHYMFNNCSSLTSLDMSNFNTQNVKEMEYVFNNCSSLTSLDVSSFNASKVTNMQFMFNNCSLLKNIDVSNFKVSTAIWYLNNVFSDCKSLEKLDISGWDLSNLKYYFNDFAKNCTSLKELKIGANYMKTIKTSDKDNLQNAYEGVGTPDNPCNLIRTSGFPRSALGTATIPDKQVPPYYQFYKGYFYIADELNCDAQEDYKVEATKTDADLWQSHRTLYGKEWNTLVLPVNLTGYQINESLGGADVCKLSKYDGNTISFETINYSPTNTTTVVIPANTPVLVKPTKDITNLGYVNVEIKEVPTNSEVMVESEHVTVKDIEYFAQFFATYSNNKPKTIGKGYFYLYTNENGEGSEFLRSNGNSTVKMTRGYFKLSDVDESTPVAAKAFKLDDGGISTNINSINNTPIGQPDGPAYNLSGQRVGNDYKGIVIINGRKVLRK